MKTMMYEQQAQLQDKMPESLNDEQLLDEAWHWLCNARKNAPVGADIWDLRFNWQTERGALLDALRQGNYRLSPMQIVGTSQNAVWSSRDALVLKWVALKITGHLPLHERCEHVRGHGGGRASVQRLHDVLNSGEYPWVCRTDIKGYYGAIQKPQLLEQLRQCIADPMMLHLLQQYLHYSVEDGGEFHTPENGISRGCALSPLMGALHLWAVDNHFSRQPGIYYARYMDDFIILAKSRWQLKRQVKSLNRFFNEYQFCQHPDKTFIGRTAKGFDWMGAQLNAQGAAGVAPRALANHLTKIRRLYEQTWLSRSEREEKVSNYRRRWVRWVAACGLLCTGPVGAVEIGYGYTPLGTWSPSVTTTQRNSTNSWVYPTTFGLHVYPFDNYNPTCNMDSMVPDTLNGYRGVRIRPGVLLIYTGTVSGTNRLSTTEGSRTEFYTGTWDSHGNLAGSIAANNPGASCVGTAKSSDIPSLSPNSTASANITYGVYVAPGTPATTYSGGVLYFVKGAGGLDTRAQAKMTFPPITVVPTACTLTTAVRVAFGPVVPGDAPPSYVTDLLVACTKRSGAPAVTASVVVSPVGSDAGGVTTLRLTDGRGGVSGDIRGFLGDAAPGESGCLDKPSSVRMDGTPTEILTLSQAASSASTSKPLIWVLCPRPDASPGVATATASIEVNW